MELLKLEHISKQFPGVKALSDVSFSVEGGKVHALLGENGAGKSTLIKIISGIYKPDEGSLQFDGKPLKVNTPADAKSSGISVVHQEIKLVNTLSIAENIFMGKLFTKGPFVDWPKVRREAKAILGGLGVEMDVERKVSGLSVSEQQIVEICKALTNDAKLIIMDEPSATLTDKELTVLFSTIGRLKSKGISIVYISHRLDEIFGLCDDLTVLRDGCVIGSRKVADTSRKELISMMVGREIENEYPKEFIERGETVLEVGHLCRKDKLNDINLFLRKGEILGIAGLVGSGRTELARAALGIDKSDSGSVSIKGKAVRYKAFSSAIDDGFGFVTEDRKNQGLVLNMSVERNITLVAMDQVTRHGFINRKKEAQAAEKFVKKMNISVPGIKTEVQSLSGGNQQKVVIAKWLMQDADIFIVDEPTRGIDVGAKAEIYKILTQLVKEGKSILMISSEMPELIGMCDRIYVMHEGSMKGVLEREEFSQQKILELAMS